MIKEFLFASKCGRSVIRKNRFPEHLVPQLVYTTQVLPYISPYTSRTNGKRETDFANRALRWLRKRHSSIVIAEFRSNDVSATIGAGPRNAMTSARLLTFFFLLFYQRAR